MRSNAVAREGTGLPMGDGPDPRDLFQDMRGPTGYTVRVRRYSFSRRHGV